MSLPQHVIKDVGGTISIDIDGTLPTAATVTVKTGSGTIKADGQSATVPTASTTASSAITAGDRTIAVASATGITAGTKLWLRTPDEKVTVKSISGTTATLWAPVLQDHASGVVVEGSTITYSVTSGQADSTWWDGRADWSLDGTYYDTTAVECTLYPLKRLATSDDLQAELPQLFHIISDERNAEVLLDLAHEEILSQLAGNRVRVFTASREFIRATVLQAASIMFRSQASEDADLLYERYKMSASEEINRVVQLIPRDTDQDGTIEAEEKLSPRSITLNRG